MSNMIRTIRRSSLGPIAWVRNEERGVRLSSLSSFMSLHSIPFSEFIALKIKRLIARHRKSLNRKVAAKALRSRQKQ